MLPTVVMKNVVLRNSGRGARCGRGRSPGRAGGGGSALPAPAERPAAASGGPSLVGTGMADDEEEDEGLAL